MVIFHFYYTAAAIQFLLLVPPAMTKAAVSGLTPADNQGTVNSTTTHSYPTRIPVFQGMCEPPLFYGFIVNRCVSASVMGVLLATGMIIAFLGPVTLNAIFVVSCTNAVVFMVSAAVLVVAVSLMGWVKHCHCTVQSWPVYCIFRSICLFLYFPFSDMPSTWSTI